MASPTRSMSQQAAIPFWRDVRVLAILGQVIFFILVVILIAWITNNTRAGLARLGIPFDFSFLWRLPAQFDIGEGIEFSPTDTYMYALWVGIVNTIRVIVIGIPLAVILGTVTGISRLSSNWLLNKIATIYIETVRNIPLLVQLFFFYFAVILQLPSLRDSSPVLGLPIYLNNRGFFIPSAVPTAGFVTWLAFIVLALIQVQVLWIILSRREERTGRAQNKFRWAVLSFIALVLIGWYLVSAYSTDQGFLVHSNARIDELDDFEGVALARAAENGVQVESLDALSQAQLDPGLLKKIGVPICVVEGSAAEVNMGRHLRQRNVPVTFVRGGSATEVASAYAAGECVALAGSEAVLASALAIQETPADHRTASVGITPLVASTPRLEGLNLQGGLKLSPEFAAILIGLVIYTGAFMAEIVRAGILSVNKGQSEAARALGLNEGQRLQLVVLPQALRVIIPPMTSQFLNLAKNSTLAVAIGFPDVVSVGQTTINQSGRSIEVIIFYMAVFLTISLSLSALLNWYNKRIALVER
ncbi:MAG: ABC transporter permease subunit [Anaerolineae bacterium]